MPRPVLGSKADSVSGELVDCGNGLSMCRNAENKICLIQRGGNTLFCQMAWNCHSGGGVGVLIYNSDEADECAPVTPPAPTYKASGCPGAPGGQWPVSITIPREDGRYLREMLGQGETLNVWLDTTDPTNPMSLDFMSGTSMATPLVAGVAGVLWSKFTNCKPEIITQALKQNTTSVEGSTVGMVNAKAALDWLNANHLKECKVEPPRNAYSDITEGTMPRLAGVEAAVFAYSNVTTEDATINKPVYISARYTPGTVKRGRPKQKVKGGGIMPVGKTPAPSAVGVPLTLKLAQPKGKQLLSCQGVKDADLSSGVKLKTDPSGKVTLWCTIKAEGKLDVTATVVDAKKGTLTGKLPLVIQDKVKRRMARQKAQAAKGPK